MKSDKHTNQDGGRQKVVFLLPVWGSRYIQRFSEIGLKTLLAPGNIPAMAGAFDCEFIFLTRNEDVEFFDQLASVTQLRQFCDVSFRDIDSLIIDSTYAVTITMAFANAVREYGEGMLERYFVFLVADYIMADGSLKSLIPHIQEGRSAIQAGNFQVVEEEFLPLLENLEDNNTHSINISPRTLVSMALKHLHPITYANFAEVSTLHAKHCNRLFWQAGDAALVGRFFLLHMLCLRPEVVDFKIGSSCDYSFLPEMCPSGDWHTFTDSDDYLVVEHQPRLHEYEYLDAGALDKKDLVKLTKEWTTEFHRENIHSALLFHGDAPDSEQLLSSKAKSDQFIHTLMQQITTPPQPVRGHPYWIGAVEDFLQVQEMKGNRFSEEWGLDKVWTSLPTGFARISVLKKMFRCVFGTPPHVRPWHHLWFEYRQVVREVEKRFRGNEGPLMVVSESAGPISKWLLEEHPLAQGFQTTRLITSEAAPSNAKKFQACFVFLLSDELNRIGDIIESVQDYLKDGAEIIISVHNDNVIYLFNEFRIRFLLNSPKLTMPGVCCEDVTYTYSTRRLLTEGMLQKATKYLENYGFWCFPAVFAMLIPTYLIVIFDNMTRAMGLRSKVGYCTSILIRLTKAGTSR